MTTSRCGARRGCAWLRWTALVALIAFGPVACGFWRTVPLTQIESGQENIRGVRIRLTHPGGEKEDINVSKVDFPYVEGTTPGERSPLPIRADLRQAEQIEVYSMARGTVGSVAIVIGAVALVAVIAAIIVAATKTSCPFVYVDGPGGPVLIGEAYSGATTRSTQRDDLMPLPALSAPRARLLLTNEALESQHTDRLELVVVDHDPAHHAVATPTAGVVLAEGGEAPARVTDLEGADVAGIVGPAGERLWETDMEALVPRSDLPERTGLEATFGPRPAGARDVLELDLANTTFLDLVNGRFVALMGDKLDVIRAMDADPAAAERIWRWREREGVDLAVEVARGDRWERVAVVPTVGAFGTRHVGVPLPPWSGEGPRRVRVAGGPGFWRAGHLTLSALRDDAPALRRLAPAEARDGHGVDVRDLLAAADGRHQVLARSGERVELAFDLPTLRAGATRSHFLLTTGYYLIDRPPQSHTSVRMVRALWEEPGAFRRFAVDLYREYRRIALQTARPAQGAP